MDGQRQTRWESTIGQEDGSIERLEDVDLIRSNGVEIQTICLRLKLNALSFHSVEDDELSSSDVMNVCEMYSLTLKYNHPMIRLHHAA